LEKLLYYKLWKKYSYNLEDIEAKIIDVNLYGHLILMKRDKKKIIAELKEIKFHHEL
jgi:hypothetical protein